MGHHIRTSPIPSAHWPAFPVNPEPENTEPENTEPDYKPGIFLLTEIVPERRYSLDFRLLFPKNPTTGE